MSSSSDKKRGNVLGFDGVHGSMTMKRISNWTLEEDQTIQDGSI